MSDRRRYGGGGGGGGGGYRQGGDYGGRGGGGYRGGGGGGGYRGGGGGGGYRGGGGGYRGGGGGRGRFGGREGRGGGRSDSRELDIDQARNMLQSNVTKYFSVEGPAISRDFKHPDIVRYDHGRLGKPSDVIINYVELQMGEGSADHYEIEYGDNADDAVEATEIVKKMAEENRWPRGKWAHDGQKMLFTCGEFPLPGDSGSQDITVELPFRGRQKEFTIKLRNVRTTQLQSVRNYCSGSEQQVPREALHILDVALRCGTSLNPNFLVFKNNVFPVNGQRSDITMGAEAWKGYHQSLKPCQGGLFLNVDTAVSAFHKAIKVSRYIDEFLGCPLSQRGLQDKDKRRLKACLKGVLITTDKGGVKQKIKAFAPSPREARFPHGKSGTEMTVEDYYLQENGIRLQYPNFPCLDCSRGRRLCYVPPECATIIPGQKVKVIQRSHAEKMIREGAQRPDDKQRYINDVLDAHRGDAHLSKNETAQGFGLRMDNSNLLRIAGRILPQPYLRYRRPDCMDVGTQGQWNLLDAQFFHGEAIKSWALCSLLTYDDINIPGETGIGAFLEELINCLGSNGVSMPDQEIPVHYNDGSDRPPGHELQQARALAERTYRQSPTIILVLLPGRVTSLYRAIKMESDTRMGIPTQCFLSDKAGIGRRARPPRGRNQYCNNLAMKINAKIKGVNCTLLDIPDCPVPLLAGANAKPFMIIGADVSHPQGASNSSVAALVGSLDPYAFQYACRVVVQEGRQEEIDNLKEQFKELLKEFYKRTNHKKPESIIYYRDGVSEGQFEHVLYHEYGQMREACKELGDPSSDYCPPITFVVVQKKHHTRLFPQGQGPVHRSGNVMPGTIVDTTVACPTGFDFFLCSHGGLQGTSRPAHYHVLVDENKFGPDALQIMSYWLTYTYCRCTKSVAVPAPVYYAHLAAFRARMLLEADSSADDSSMASGGPDAMLFPGVATGLKSVMFYV